MYTEESSQKQSAIRIVIIGFIIGIIKDHETCMLRWSTHNTQVEPLLLITNLALYEAHIDTMVSFRARSCGQIGCYSDPLYSMVLPFFYILGCARKR